MSGCEPKVDLGVESKAAVAGVPSADASVNESIESTDAPDAEVPATSAAENKSASEIKISDEAFRIAAHDGRIETVRKLDQVRQGRQRQGSDDFVHGDAHGGVQRTQRHCQTVART